MKCLKNAAIHLSTLKKALKRFFFMAGRTDDINHPYIQSYCDSDLDLMKSWRD